MKAIDGFLSTVSNTEPPDLQVALLEARVRQLEAIVNCLLRNQIGQEKADDWLDQCQGDHSIILSPHLIDEISKSVVQSFDNVTNTRCMNVSHQILKIV